MNLHWVVSASKHEYEKRGARLKAKAAIKHRQQVQNFDEDRSCEMAHSPGKTKGTYRKARAAEKKAALDQCRKMKTSTLKVTVSRIHLLCPTQNVNACSYPSENLEQFCGSKQQILGYWSLSVADGFFGK